MTTPATISEGAAGSTVRWAPYLRARRTLSDTQIDAIYGEQTAAAVKGPQQLGGVQADGVIGLQTSRRAKIVCTLGPATSSPGQIAALVAAGLDVARLNMSHGDHGAHRAVYDAVRAACDASGRSVGVLVDLQGPKIRLGRFAAGPVTLSGRPGVHDHRGGRAGGPGPGVVQLPGTGR